MIGEQEKIKMAKEIAMVRETAVVNMCFRDGVVSVLKTLGYNDTAEYITKNNMSDFIELLEKSAEY